MTRPPAAPRARYVEQCRAEQERRECRHSHGGPLAVYRMRLQRARTRLGRHRRSPREPGSMPGPGLPDERRSRASNRTLHSTLSTALLTLQPCRNWQILASYPRQSDPVLDAAPSVRLRRSRSSSSREGGPAFLRSQSIHHFEHTYNRAEARAAAEHT